MPGGIGMRLHPAVVTIVTPPTCQVQLLDTGQTINDVVRPTISGLATGYHWIPAAGDRVVLSYWVDSTPFILCGLSAWRDLVGSIPAGLAGEQFLYGPAGQVLSLVQGGNVAVTLAAGKSMTVKVGTSGPVTIGPSLGDPSMIGIDGPQGQYIQFEGVNGDMLVIPGAGGHLYLGGVSATAVARVGDTVSVNLTTGNGTITSGSAILRTP